MVSASIFVDHPSNSGALLKLACVCSRALSAERLLLTPRPHRLHVKEFPSNKMHEHRYDYTCTIDKSTHHFHFEKSNEGKG